MEIKWTPKIAKKYNQNAKKMQKKVAKKNKKQVLLWQKILM